VHPTRGDLERVAGDVGEWLTDRVGHEIDHSVADEVAHLSVKTPTAAARSLIDRCDTELASLVGSSRRVAQAAVHVTTQASADLDRNRERLAGAVRSVRSAAARSRLLRTDRIERAAPAHVERAEHRLTLAEATIRGADPAVQLARGWSLTRTVEGAVVTSPDQVTVGDELEITIAGGRIRTTVRDIQTDPAGDRHVEDTT